MSADDARKEARKIIGDIGRGVDPIARKEAEKVAQITLQQALEEFLSSRNLKDYTKQK